MYGRMIVVEGIDGAGKGEVLSHITTLLSGYGLRVNTTREPGGTPKAELIRDILKGEGAATTTREEDLFPLTELMLFYAARHQHVEGYIKPILAKGDWVVSDRFNLSSWAYQGIARKLPLETVGLLDKLTLAQFAPDVTFFLDVPPAIAQTRQANRDKGYQDSIEKEGLTFQEQCRVGYYNAFENPEIKTGHVIIIDASQDIINVKAQVTKELNAYLKIVVQTNLELMQSNPLLEKEIA